MAAKQDLTFILTFDAKKGTAEIQKLGKTTQQQLSAMQKAAVNAGKGVKDMSGSMDKGSQGMDKMKSRASGMWKQMAAGMGVMMGIQGAFRMVTKVISSTLQVGREFERTWANVTTMLSGEAYQAADKYKKELLSLSPVLGDSTDLAKGMYQVLSASIEPAKAVEFLGAAAKAAQAGITDTATAVDALTTVINAYGMQAEDATKVSDIMFKTVMRGKLTYEGMAGALGTVAPIAAQVGVSFEEVGAAMATLTRQGIDVNTTTVQLRQIMVSVLKPTAEAQKAAKILGIEFNSQALKAKGLAGFLADVKAKVGDNTDAMTALFGNVRALTGIMGLAGERAEEFTFDLEQMKKASGATEEAFKKQMQTTDFWIKVLTNVFNKMKIAIWEGLSQPFKKGIEDSKSMEEKMKELQSRLREFGEDIGRSIGNAIKFVIDFKDTLIALGKIFLIVFAVKKIQAWTAAFQASMIQSSANAGKFGVVLSGAGKATKGLGVAAQVAGAAFAGWTIGRWISDVTGLTKKVYTLSYALDSAGMSETVAHAKLQQMTEGMANQNQMLFKLVKEHGSYKEVLKAVSEGKIEEIKAFQGSQLALVAEEKKLKDVKEKVEEANESYSKLVAQFKNLVPTQMELTTQWQALQEAMTPLVEQSKNADLVYEKFKGTINDLYENFKFLAETMGVQIPAALEEAYKRVNKLDQGLEKIPSRTDVIIGKMTNFGKETIKIGDVVSNLPDTFENRFYKPIENSGLRATKELKKAFDIAATGIVATFRTLSDSIGGIWGNIVNTAATAVESIIGYFDGLEEGAKISFKGILSAAGPALGQLAGMLGQAISGAKKSFAGFGQSVGSSLGSMLGPVGKAVGGIVGGLIGGLFKQKETAEEKAARESKERMEQVSKSLEHLGDVSEATAQAIADDMGEGMSEAAATAKHYAEVIRDVGITQENVNELWAGAGDILNQYASGALTAEEASKSAGESFTELLEGAQRMGTEGSAAMVSFINQVKASGLEVAEVSEYINDQLGIVKRESGNAAQGLLAMAEHVALNEQALGRLENQTMAVFNAMIENGASMLEAMDALGPTLDIMAEKYEQMGITGGEGFQELMKIREVTEANQGLMSAIQGNLDVLSALANTGSLSQQSLTDAAGAAKSYYNQLIDAGLSGNQALSQMAPTLEKLRDMSAEHGLALDKNTQSLIDEAEAAGVLGERQMETTDIMMAGFGEIIRALGGQVPAAFQKSIDKMKEFGEETASTGTQMHNLEDAIYGSSVVTAVGVLGQTASDVLGKMQTDTADTTMAMSQLEGGIGLTEDEMEKLGIKSTDVNKGMRISIEDVSKKLGDTVGELKVGMIPALSDMGKVAKGEFKDMEDYIGGVQNSLGDLGKMAKQGIKINYQLNQTGGGGKGGGGAQGAQFGVDEVVTGPRHYFVEPGVKEHVKITPIDKAGSGSQTIIVERPIVMKPLVISADEFGNMLIKFLEEAADDERLALPPKGIRRR